VLARQQREQRQRMVAGGVFAMERAEQETVIDVSREADHL
jgi:hypothetical protein